jgi:proteic killer suppression protein
VIKSFRHKGLERFFTSGSKAGIRAAHAQRLARQLARLDAARRPEDMAVPGWRLILAFDGEDAVLVDYQDYH